MPGALFGEQVSEKEKDQKVEDGEEKIRQQSPAPLVGDRGEQPLCQPSKGVKEKPQPQQAKEQHTSLQGRDRGFLPISQF